MPEHIRAFVYIVVIAGFVFFLARPVALQTGYTANEYRNHLLMWFFVTFLLFFSHNFWLYSVITGLIMLVAARKTTSPLALYGLLLLAAPGFLYRPIPGFGPIETLISFNHVRLMNLTILLPLAIHLSKAASHVGPKWSTVDRLVLVFVLYLCIRQAIDLSLTQTVRSALTTLIDIWLPYYVFSRTIRSFESLHKVAFAFCLGITLIAAVAWFESLRGWLLYESLRVPLSEPTGAFYLMRGDGLLRARASAGHPIVLGYLTVIALGLLVMISAKTKSLRSRLYGCAAILIGGLVFSFSRGPWVGSIVLLIAYIALIPSLGKKLKWAAVFLTAGTVILLTPYGQRAIDYLPFIGTVEAENIEYRSRLLETSKIVIQQNLFFGDINFLDNPILETMRQGQGIIDITNTYLQYALAYGVIGLGLFLLIFVSSAISVLRLANENTQLTGGDLTIRSLVSILTGIAVIIVTVSSIFTVAPLYWIVIALLTASSRILSAASATQRGPALKQRRPTGVARPRRPNRSPGEVLKSQH